MTIFSASRRTDIPAFHADEFIEAVKRGYFIDNNKVPSTIPNESIVFFWTRDIRPMLKYIPTLINYGIHVACSYTIVDYPKPIHTSALPTIDEQIEGIIQLSRMIGPWAIAWRYDPIFTCEKLNITEEYHVERFTYIAKKVAPFISRCTVSLLDMYGKIIPKMQQYKDIGFVPENKRLLQKLRGILDKQIEMTLCAENIKVDGIVHKPCIDGNWLSKAMRVKLTNVKDSSQRYACSCIPSIDIGTYKTCKHNCLYCYAS